MIDNASRDGGDSANRAGLLALFGSPEPLGDYEASPGRLVRHPLDEPWNNPGNFSRDQLLPFIAGAARQKKFALIRRVFWAHVRRLGFAQNFERDAAGTRKFPWPHRFVNDHGRPEHRWFDFADPLSPSDLYHFVRAGRLWFFYPLAFIAWPILVLELVGHGLFNRSNDEGQMIAKAVVAGPFFVWLYKKVTPNWRERLRAYWTIARDQSEITDLIVRHLDPTSSASERTSGSKLPGARRGKPPRGPAKD